MAFTSFEKSYFLSYDLFNGMVFCLLSPFLIFVSPHYHRALSSHDTERRKVFGNKHQENYRHIKKRSEDTSNNKICQIQETERELD